MKFRYKKYSPTILRPVIPTEIIFNEKSIKYEVLVDSGADICIFDAQIGEIIGIDIKKGEKKTVSGITGKSEFYFLHSVKLNVGGWRYTVKVGFLPNMSNQTYGVVGQKGFFDKYSVKFDLNKEEIELRESINPHLN